MASHQMGEWCLCKWADVKKHVKTRCYGDILDSSLTVRQKKKGANEYYFTESVMFSILLFCPRQTHTVSLICAEWPGCLCYSQLEAGRAVCYLCVRARLKQRRSELQHVPCYTVNIIYVWMHDYAFLYCVSLFFSIIILLFCFFLEMEPHPNDW